MFLKILLIVIITNAQILVAADIPIDSFSGKSWILSSEGEGKVLNGYLGRDRQWKVREDSTFAMQSNLILPKDNLWKEYFIISENMPFNAVNDASQRIWNLPDMIDRLQLEKKLPSSIKVVNSSDREMLIVVTKPTVISSSIATFRHITIINRSKLVILCPLCRNISVVNEDKESLLEIYSYLCFDANGVGKIKRYNLGEWLLACKDSSKIIEPEGLMSAMQLFPQILVSQTLGRKPSELFILWNEFMKVTL